MHEGHRKRVKERYLKSGLSGFAEHEALEFLLFFSIKRKNTNEIAHRLLDRFRSFSGVLEADIRDLLSVEGIGPETALFLKSIPEFSNYYRQNRWKAGSILYTSADAGFYCMDLIGELLHEVFYVICLDKNRKVLASIKLSEGSLESVDFDMRKLTFEVLKYPTKGIILTHNHPSGIGLPSYQDRALTMKVIDHFENMGIDVIDHVIVCGRRFLSMSETGLMDESLPPELSRRLSD